jgi:spoIIIJ-associated protein
MKNPARVRARIRPTVPRPKVERRDRRRRDEKAPRGRGRNGAKRSPAADATSTDDGDLGEVIAESESADDSGDVVVAAASSGAPARRRRRSRGGTTGKRPLTEAEEGSETQGASTEDDKGTDMPELSLTDQGRIVSEFLDGLIDSFGLTAETTAVEVDDENIEVRVEGENLGLLVGPKGRTLQALTEVARSIVVRHGEGSSSGRVHIDVAGYRQRRREALARFTRDVAQQVMDSGTARALEPMSPADRKVIHDTVNEIDGVASTSEGDEPNRRVVISPA